MNTIRMQKWGNSQGFRIPKALLNTLNWNEKYKFNITMQDNSIVITPAEKEEITLKKLFENYDGTYEPAEIDWGTPLGKEVL